MKYGYEIRSEFHAECVAQRQNLYESQKQITDQLTAILAKIEGTEIRSASIAQYQKRIDSLDRQFYGNDTVLNKLGETSDDYFNKKFFQNGVDLIKLCRTAMQKYGQTSAEAILAPKKAENLEESQMESSHQKSLESIRISIKDEVMEQVRFMMHEFLHQLKPNLAENSKKELERAPRELENAPREPENASREPENIPREPENAPGEEENTSKEEKVKTHDDAGIRKEEEVTKHSTENKKSSWEKIMVDIKQIHRELVVNHSVKDDIDEELELIDKLYGEALKEILIKISTMQEEKKAVVLETIKIPIFNGDMEEWCSFQNMFNRFVHMSKLPAVEKLVRLKTHVRGEALKIIQNLPKRERSILKLARSNEADHNKN
ncbi:hypothetical protein CVS40_4883 [Lucilia cuprina]|nr:hypothetical protein CVS40_4883 [Lucilia cuprina]